MRPSPHPRIGRTLLILGDAYLAIGDAQRAEGALRDALDEFAGIPATHWRVGETKSLLGAALRWQGRETEAVDLLVDGLQTIRNHLGPAAAASRRAAALLASAPGER